MNEFRDLLQRSARPHLANAIEGVRICQGEYAAPPVTSTSGTVLALMARGGKRLALGDRTFDYGAGDYLVAPADLPVTGHVVGAAPGRPTLGFGLVLDPADVADLVGEAELPERAARPGIVVSAAPHALLDAVVRLLRLLDEPRDREALAPLYKREILWRLLTGEQGDAVRRIVRPGPIARAVRWIREHYAEPFRVDEMARNAGMCTATFHRHFRRRRFS
jgi:AraC-type transcriptional regulator